MLKRFNLRPRTAPDQAPALHSIDPTHSQIVELSYGIAYQFMKSIFGEESRLLTVHLRHAPVSVHAAYLPFF